MEKTLKKWDFEKHRYEDVPNIYGIELKPPFGTWTRCANCGMAIEVNSKGSRVSDQWHNPTGWGYLVCGYCFELEQFAKEKFKTVESGKWKIEND